MRRDRGARQGEGYWTIVFAVALCAYGSRENLEAEA
jgi:hypothetical protein